MRVQVVYTPMNVDRKRVSTRVKTGVESGITAFAASTGLIGVLMLCDRTISTDSLAFGEFSTAGNGMIRVGGDPGIITQLVWGVIGSHGNSIVVTVGEDTSTVNPMYEYTTFVPRLTYFIIPIVVLVCIGFAVSLLTDADTAPRGWATGATAALGYVACAGGIVLAPVTAWTIPPLNATYNIIAWQTLVVTGVVYPVVFAGVGGALGSFFRLPDASTNTGDTPAHANANTDDE